MKFLFDFFPILLFFIAYKVQGIYVATTVAIIATLIQVGLFWIKHRRFEKMHLITLALIAFFGGATLLFQDDMFIKWKPTVLNWLFAAVFLGSHFVGEKTVAERMMSATVSLPISIWKRLNLSWIVYFILLGFANIYVVYNFDTDTWVDFKLFGMMGMTFLFVIAQAFYLTRHVKEIPQPAANNTLESENYKTNPGKEQN